MYFKLIIRSNIKRSKRNNKFVQVDISDLHKHRRYLYTLLKFFEIEGYTIHIATPSFKQFHRIIKKRTYLELAFQEENFLLQKINSNRNEKPITFSDKNLSSDYFSFLNSKKSYHIPMTMHPKMYYTGIWNEEIDIEKTRKCSVFMIGNFEKEMYSKFDEALFGMQGRNSVYDFLQQNLELPQFGSQEELYNYIKSSENFECVIIDRRIFEIEMKFLRNTLSHFSFFLALPGVTMPYSHNLIEALSVGCIPIIHKEYAKLLFPELKPLNAIIYSSLSDLLKIITSISSIAEEQLTTMKVNALNYYHSYLTPKAVTGTIERRKESKYYLINENKSVVKYKTNTQIS